MPNPVGRPRGPSQSTERARHAISAFVNGNAGRLTGWLDRIAKDNPKAAFDSFMSVIEYHIPKLQRSEIDMDVKSDLASAPTSTINIILNSLRALQDVTPKADSLIDSQARASAPNSLIDASGSSPAEQISYEVLKDNERSDSLLSDFLPQNEILEGVRTGGSPPLDHETGTLFPEKNKGHTADGIEPDRKRKRGRPPKNFSGVVTSGEGEIDSPSGIRDEISEIGDISALL